MVVTKGEGWGAVKGKGGQIYGDGRWFNFGWWAHNAIYRPCITEMYTWNLYNFLNQNHPKKFNLKIKIKLTKKSNMWSQSDSEPEGKMAIGNIIGTINETGV